MPRGTCSRRFDACGAGISLAVVAVTPFQVSSGVAGIGPAAWALWHGTPTTGIRSLHAGQAFCVVCAEVCRGPDLEWQQALSWPLARLRAPSTRYGAGTVPD